MNLNKLMVGLYLLAVVTSNIIVNKYGQMALIVTSVILIPFDLTSRDFLHDSWKHNRLLKMTLLILSGSIITVIINRNSYNVALASFVAFIFANTVDYIVYSLLMDKKRSIKMNISNIFSSVTDSIIFPVIAFGSFSYMISMSQSLFKILGGLAWSYLLSRIIKNTTKEIE